MPRKIQLPPNLSGTAFLTSDIPFHSLGRGRLRGRGVEHPFHGISSVALDTTSTLGLCRAFEVRLRAGEFFSHLTAAMLFGMPVPPSSAPSTLHVSALAPLKPSHARGVRGHAIALGNVSTEMRLGLPVVSAADTWFHIASVMSREDLVAVGDYLISGTRLPGGGRTPAICSRAELEDAVARHAGWRGSKNAAWAVTRLRTGVDSRPESLMRLILEAADIRELEVNVPTLVDDGRRELHGDLTIRRLRVVLEYEGEGHLTSKKQFRRDITRRELFEAAGHRVIRVTADDIFVDQQAFLRRVRTVLRQREAEFRGRRSPRDP